MMSSYRWRPTLPKAPYVLTMWNGLNDAFIAWRGLAMFRAGHQLRTTTRTARIGTKRPKSIAIGSVRTRPGISGATSSQFLSALLMALCIPITLAMTFGVVYMLGIDLQQVSVATLIIALGLLVDVPVVSGDGIKRGLADGLPRSVAAWLGPTKLATAITRVCRSG